MIRPDGLENAAASPTFRTSVGPVAGAVAVTLGAGDVVVALPDGKPMDGNVISDGTPADWLATVVALVAGAVTLWVLDAHPARTTVRTSSARRPKDRLMEQA